MNYDDIKIAESVQSENDYVDVQIGIEPEIAPKGGRFRRFMQKWNLDPLDLAIVPMALGVAISLGYLVFNVVTAVSGSPSINTGMTDVISAIF